MFQMVKQWSYRVLNQKVQSQKRNTLQSSKKATNNNMANFVIDNKGSCQLKSHIQTIECSSFSCQVDQANTDKWQKVRKTSENCSCSNCVNLLVFIECGVCLEPLQGNEIESCSVCANFVCKSCASRLLSCAFCRTKLSLQRNRAIERIFNSLTLPCKNSSHGCRALLNGDSRFTHETFCNYSVIKCPLGKFCKWRGTVAIIQYHFTTTHDLLPVPDHGITIEIHRFRKKALSTDGRQYTICLMCYEQLFIMKIILYRFTLRILLSRVGYVRNVPLKSRLMTYGISVEVSGGEKRLGGFLVFEKPSRGFREIIVNCENLHYKNDNSKLVDLVKISASVQEDPKKSKLKYKPMMRR